MKKKINIDDLILYKNVIGTMGLKGISIIVSFLTTSMYISYFRNSSILGVWFTLLSILQWILTFDFGVGNGLRNKLAPSIELNDRKAIKQYISSGYLALVVVSLIVAIIGTCLINGLRWNFILNIPTKVLSEKTLKLSVFITFIGILIQFVLKIITSILYALRKNVVANATMLLSNLLLCLYLFWGRWLDCNSSQKLIYLALAYVFVIMSPLLVVTIYVFNKELKGFFPSFKFFDRRKAKEVLSLGGGFFIIQLELLILTSTDSWFVMYLFNPEDVVSYQVYYKLFSLPTTMFALISQPLWSSITVALARKDFLWIRKKEKAMYFLALVTSIFCMIEVILSPFIIRIWIGNQGCEINKEVALWFGILSVGQLFMYASTSIANGISKIGCQAVCNMIAVALKFTLTFYLANVMEHWVSILIVETIGTFIIAIVQPIFNRLNLKNDLLR